MELIKRIEVVEIPKEESTKVERLWYEYNASRDIIKFLMSDKTVIWETLQEYINVAEKRFTELEMVKQAVASAYRPATVDLAKWNYSFDFNNYKIVFEEA